MYRLREWLSRCWINLRLLGGLLVLTVRRLFGAADPGQPDAPPAAERFDEATLRSSELTLRRLAAHLAALPAEERDVELRKLRRQDALTYLRVRRLMYREPD